MAIKLFANYEHGKVGIMDMSRGPWDLPRWACHIPVRLSRGLATLRVPHPCPLVAGISHAARAFSLPARRGDLPHCVRHIPSRSPRGPLQSCGKSRSCAAGAAIPFMPNALQKQAFDGLGHKRNQHRVAMLTP